MPDIPSLIEAVAGDDEQHRTLLYAFYDQHTLTNQSTGNNWVQPADSTQKPSTTPPAVGRLSVNGANGTYQVAVTNPTQAVNATIYNEISYSTIKSFGQNVTTMQPSAALSVTIPAPGQMLFFRARWSYDKVTWSSYVLAQTTAIASNLMGSAASENNTPLNQSNYAYVDSIATGGTASVRVYGAAGPYNGYAAVKGGVEAPRPSATIVNVAQESTQLIAYDGEQYRPASTLPGVFPDPWETVGQVSVVGSGTPTLPVITPVINAGHLIAATFTPGAGLTQAPTLTVTDTGGGTGAVIIAIISGGQMTGYDIQAAGSGYTGATAITPTGGVFSGATGGGTATGGNGGRLTKI